MKDKRIRHQISFKLNPETDQDIIEHLAGISNIQGYLKGMIRGQIAYQAYHKELEDKKWQREPLPEE